MNQPSDPTPLSEHYQHLKTATAGKGQREQAAIVEEYLTPLLEHRFGPPGVTRRKPIPAWLARRRTRRLLAASPALPLLCGMVAATTDHIIGALFGLAMVVGVVAFWGLLRRATTVLADATDDLLDEREAGERDASYRHAYPTLLALICLIPLVAIVEELTSTTIVTGDGWRTLGTTIMLTGALLPSAVIAWRWRDPDDSRD